MLARGDTISGVAGGLTVRMKKRIKYGSPTCVGPDRHLNPLVAIQSSPGGGKTAALDAVALLSSKGLWDERSCADADMRAILNTSIPIPFTYDGDSRVDLSSYDKKEGTGLGLRMLHAFFVRPEVMSFAEFSRLMPEDAYLTEGEAIHCCLLAAERATGTKRGVVLLVDDIQELFKAKPDRSGPHSPMLLTKLGSMLDVFGPGQLNIVCTTLDTSVRMELSICGRRIIWPPLPALGQHAAESLLLRALQRSFPAVAALPDTVRITISDAAGHPRSLQYVKDAMLDLCSGPGGVDVVHSPHASKALRDGALKHMDPAVTPKYDAERAALRGRRIDVSRSLDHEAPRQKGEPVIDNLSKSEKPTSRLLISAGVFINADETSISWGYIAPKLSMLRLLQFARSQPHHEASVAIRAIANDEQQQQPQQEQQEEEAAVHHDGAASTLPSTLNSNSSSNNFAVFVTHWLRLTAVIRAGERLNAATLFHAAPWGFGLPQLEGPLASAGFTLTKAQLRGPVQSSVGDYVMETIAIGGQHDGIVSFDSSSDSNPAVVVLLPAATPPNWTDVAVLDDDKVAKTGGYVAVAVVADSRHATAADAGGRPATAAAESNRDVDNDISSEKALFAPVRPLLERFDPAPAQLLYAYVTGRQVKHSPRKQVLLAQESILVLGNEPPLAGFDRLTYGSLHDAFGPTLAHQALFLLNHSSATAGGKPTGSLAQAAAGAGQTGTSAA